MIHKARVRSGTCNQFKKQSSQPMVKRHKVGLSAAIHSPREQRAGRSNKLNAKIDGVLANGESRDYYQGKIQVKFFPIDFSAIRVRIARLA
jgi:hypothetical protein